MPDPGAIHRSMTPGEWGLLLLLSVLWGGSFFFVGIAIRELPVVTIVLLRVGIAALVLAVALRAMGMRLPSQGEAWVAFVGMGLLSNIVPFCLIAWGQKHIASGVAAILNATTPLWSVILAHVLTADEKMTGSRLLGVAVGFAGVVLMVGPGALAGLGGTALPQLVVLAAAISYAFAGIYGRRFRRLGIAALPTATGQLLVSTAMLLPLALLVDRPLGLPMPAASTWAAVLGLAVLSTAVAYVLFFRILATAGATNVVLVTFLIPVTAGLLGWLFLSERLEPTHLLGMACIAAGLAAIDGRLLRWRRATA